MLLQNPRLVDVAMPNITNEIIDCEMACPDARSQCPTAKDIEPAKRTLIRPPDLSMYKPTRGIRKMETNWIMLNAKFASSGLPMK